MKLGVTCTTKLAAKYVLVCHTFTVKLHKIVLAIVPSISNINCSFSSILFLALLQC